MSVEFFEIMEKIEKKVKSVKFLENSHPEITNVCMGQAETALATISHLEEKIIEELRKGTKNDRHSKSKSKGKTKV